VPETAPIQGPAAKLRADFGSFERGDLFMPAPFWRALPAASTGFGGGLHTKRFLLEHEGALLPLG
jgi:hypothetical protein